MDSVKEDFVAWKSTMAVGVAPTRVVTAKGKGWGRSGALSDPLVTRQGALEGFTVSLRNEKVPSLFIGFTTLQSTLLAAGRAHQDDLDFGIRVSSDGVISYHSKRLAQQYYHATLTEAESLGELEAGDTLGMRLHADRAGFTIFRLERGAATGSSQRADGTRVSGVRREVVLKSFREVLAFPMRLMLVLGNSGAQAGPVCWLRSAVAAAPAQPARPGGLLDLPPPPGAAGGGGGGSWGGGGGWGERVVKGRHAGDMLDRGAVDESGAVLLMTEADEGGWAAGVVKKVKVAPKGSAESERLQDAAAELFGADAAKRLGEGGAKKSKAGHNALSKGATAAERAAALPLPRAADKGAAAGKAKEKVAMAALQPKRVAGKGERLLPKAHKPEPPAASGGSKRARDGARAAAGGGGAGLAAAEVVELAAEEEEAREGEMLAPLTRGTWVLLSLALHSPFLSDSQRAALEEAVQRRRDGHASLTLRQLKLLAAAVDHLTPGAPPLAPAQWEALTAAEATQQPPFAPPRESQGQGGVVKREPPVVDVKRE